MGQMPQKLEHLLLARQIGIKLIIVYVNKVDLLLFDKDTLELVEFEVRELLFDFGSDGNDCLDILGSALEVLNGV
jgi:elongation factor Tu